MFKSPGQTRLPLGVLWALVNLAGLGKKRVGVQPGLWGLLEVQGFRLKG